MRSENSESVPRNRGQGDQHLDDRTPLAYAYDGVALVAVGYREEIVEQWENVTDYCVVRTPEGER